MPSLTLLCVLTVHHHLNCLRLRTPGIDPQGGLAWRSATGCLLHTPTASPGGSRQTNDEHRTSHSFPLNAYNDLGWSTTVNMNWLLFYDRQLSHLPGPCGYPDPSIDLFG